MAKIVGLTFAPAAPDVYTCPHCGKEYKTEDGLTKHIAEKHSEADGTAKGE